MIDIRLLLEKPKIYKNACSSKGVNSKVVDEIIVLEKKRKKLLISIENLRKERNKISAEIKKSKIKGEKYFKDQIQKVKVIKTKLSKLEPDYKTVEKKLTLLLCEIPNPPADDVKIGKDDTENDVIKKWGNPPTFKFTPKDHLELGEYLDIIDVKRAAKVSGARFYYLKGDGALLEWALLRFAYDELSKEGFIPIIPPVLIKKKSMWGMGYLEHGGEDDMYILDKDNLVLVGTSEQSIGPMHMNEILPKNRLPLRYMGYSACFRREAGSYGKDTRGILRVHQFNKVEMFSFTCPEDSDKEHEFLLSIEERLFQALKIPYQVVKMCSGDLGAPASRKYDIEAWIPTQNKYREVTSTSNTTDFQSRRLNIKYKNGDKKEYVHMLNGTAFSMGRPIIAILENYQKKDGSVVVPDVLRKYIGKDKLTPSS